VNPVIKFAKFSRGARGSVGLVVLPSSSQSPILIYHMQRLTSRKGGGDGGRKITGVAPPVSDSATSALPPSPSHEFPRSADSARSDKGSMWHGGATLKHQRPPSTKIR
jgi:hypothetical protein